MTMNDRERTSGSECALHADALAALVDGMLDARGQRRVDEHLADCAACRDLLADLREIRALAASLEPVEPPARVRHDVRRRIAAEERTPRVAVGWWRHWSLGRAALAAAAGIVLAVVLTGSPDRVRSPAADVPLGRAFPPAAGDLERAERAYVAAIRDLEQLSSGRVPVHPATHEVLIRNLAVVDRAIAESRSAVAAAPDSQVARDRLRAGLARKFTLLRTAATLELEPGWTGRLGGNTP